MFVGNKLIDVNGGQLLIQGLCTSHIKAALHPTWSTSYFQ